MHTQDSTRLVARFFDAINLLINEGTLRGKAEFCRRYGIDRRNFAKLEADPSRQIFQPAWLEYLVRDYHISPHYLLTGSLPLRLAVLHK